MQIQVLSNLSLIIDGNEKLKLDAKEDLFMYFRNSEDLYQF